MHALVCKIHNGTQISITYIQDAGTGEILEFCKQTAFNSLAPAEV